MFQEYIDHGWKICRIEPGTKGPNTTGWNTVEKALQSADGIKGAGLLHAYSGTCSFDVDDVKASKPILEANGIDLDALLAAPDAVQLCSGRENRAKLIYGTPWGSTLVSKKFGGGAFELRCGSAGGKSVQDVLPPSIHPDTGKPYFWVGDWRKLPPLPEALKKLWEFGSSVVERSVSEPVRDSRTANILELEELLRLRGPNTDYDDWLKVGMALHYETGGSGGGLALWDNWSAPGPRYEGFAVLSAKWASFKDRENPVTGASLRRSIAAKPEDFDIEESGSSEAEVEPREIKYVFIKAGEFVKRPEPEWRIPGILPAVGIGAIWGPSKSGKTFLAVDVALAVAYGQNWRGVPARPGNVLYIAAEDDSGVQMRLNAAMMSRGYRDAEIRVLADAPPLTSKVHTKALLEAVKALGPQALVFVDTLASVMPGADENSSRDIGAVVNVCKRIQKITGGTVAVVHHSGKTEGRGMRGSSALEAALDFAWEVVDEKTHREMRISKMKNAAADLAYAFDLAPVNKSCIVEWQ